MRKSTRRYGSYRGRSTATQRLRWAAAVLAVLVVLAVVGLWVGQRYIVYTDDGIRWDVPFLRREEEPLPPLDPEDLQVVVEPAQPEPEPEVPETPPEEPEPWLRAAELSLDEGDPAGKARELGANGIIFDMKTDWGALNYASKQALAPENGGDNAALAAKLAAAKEEGFYLVARVSCFRDHRLAEDPAYAIETNPGRRWSDLDGVRWSSPSSQTVRDYLVGVAAELGELGFDEVLLDNWGYPTSSDGHLEYIKKGAAYDVGKLEGNIDAFLAQAAKALEGTDTRLSLMGDDALNGKGEGGQTVEQLNTVPGRVWLTRTGDVDPIAALEGAENAGHRLVEIVSGFDQERERSQSVWTKRE